MEPVAELAVVLVAADPRGAADRTLSYLIAVHGAMAGAVLTVKDGAVTAYVNHDVDSRTLGEIQSTWATLERQLQDGEIRTETRLLWPLRDGERLTGVVFLEGFFPAVSERLFSTFGIAIAQAVQLRDLKPAPALAIRDRSQDALLPARTPGMAT